MRDAITGRFLKLPDLPKDEIIDLYLKEKLSAKKIAQQFGVCQMSILGLLKRENIQRRPANNRIYTLNEDFFSTWSKDMAYVLGFITADGYIKKPSICIRLHEKDLCILEYIKRVTKSGAPIKTIIDKSKGGNRIHRSLDIMSNKLCDQLEIYGVVRVKTGKEKLPKIPSEFQSAYLLGLFDGDGCVQFHQKKRNGQNYIRTDYSFEIVSLCEKFLLDIRDMLGVGSVVWAAHMYRYGVYNIKDLNKLHEYLYTDPPFVLERKKNIFDRIIAHGVR